MKRLLAAALCLLLLGGCREKPAVETPAPVPSPSPLSSPSSTPAPTPSVQPSPEPTPDPIPDGSFAALLAGDTSGILDPEDRGHVDWLFSNVTTPSFNPVFEISSLWVYTLLDLDGDGTEELFLRPRDAWYSHLIFKAEAGGLRLVGEKSVAMYEWLDPLADGRLMETMHYDGMYTYTVFSYGSPSDPTDVWTYRYEDRLHYVGEEPESPAWTHNGQSLTEEEFNERFRRQVTDLLVTDWRTAAIPDTISATAGTYEPLLRGDLSLLKDEQRDYIQLVFSVDWDWEYALVDLDGDGGEELFMRVAGIPAVSRIFHEEDGTYTCWYLQDDPSHVFEPLSDGRCLDIYSRRNRTTHHVIAFGTDPKYPGMRRETASWTHEVGQDGEAPSWYQTTDYIDTPVTQGEYERFLRSCEEQKIPYWNTVHFHFDKEEN